MLRALGYLVYFAPEDGEVRDLCQALDAKGTVGVSAEGENKALAEQVARLF